MRTMIYVLLSFLLVGCTLGAKDEGVVEEDIATHTPIGLVTDTPLPTSTNIQPSATPQSTATIQPAATTQLPKQLENCEPRDDWEEYTVASGDTLYSIAVAIGSTTNVIISGNCLENPDLLSVGQTIRVPPNQNVTDGSIVIKKTDIPSLPTVPPTINVVGTLNLNPYAGYKENTIIVMDGATVGLGWGNYPQELVQVEFMYYPSNSPGNGVPIGIDTDLSDGAFINWTVPQGARGRIAAAGRWGENHDTAEAYVYIMAWSLVDDTLKAPEHTGTINIDVHTKFENNTYYLENNDYVNVLLSNAPINASSVTFYYQTDFADRDNTLVNLGTKSNSGGSYFVGWQLPGGVDGHVYAELLLYDGTKVKTPSVDVYAEILGTTDIGSLEVSNFVDYDATTDEYTFESGSTVNFIWADFPDSITQAEFTYYPNSDFQNGQQIGIDNNVNDGVGLSWTVPEGAKGRIHAGAAMNNEINEYVVVWITFATP